MTRHSSARLRWPRLLDRRARRPALRRPARPADARAAAARRAAARGAAPPTRGRARSTLLAKQTDLRVQNIDAGAAAVGQRARRRRNTSPTRRRRRSACPNGQPRVRVAASSPTTPVARVDQRIYDPRDASRAARSGARRSRRVAGARRARRCSRCGRGRTTRSSPPRCCRSSSARSTATLDDLEARLRETNTRVREGAALPASAARHRGDAAAAAPAAPARLRVEAARAALARLVGADRPRASIDGRRGRAARADRPRWRRRATGADSRARAAGIRAVRSRARPRRRQQAVTDAADRPAAVGVRPRRIRQARAELHQRSAAKATRWAACSCSGRRGTGARRTASARRSRSSRRSCRLKRRRSRAALRRAIETDLAAIDHLEASLPTDDRIVALRESIDRTAQVAAATRA